MTATNTMTPTNTTTATSTATATNTATFTPTATYTATATFTPTPQPVPVFSNAVFTYDGDGQRVKSEMTTNLGTTTTYFISNYYEVTDDGRVTKYYYAGAQRVAMRQYKIPEPDTLTYILSDHLGSTSLTTDATGNLLSEMRYTPWGEVRYDSGNTPTKYQYTGQFSYAQDFGLLFYNARWYDPYLNHFTQPDSIVPTSVQGVQAWDRYAYANNNPLKYNDPSGHCVGLGNCFMEIVGAGFFLANRVINNGGLSEQDFVDAANVVAPAVASGSKESVSVYFSEMVAAVGSVTLITTADGQSQVFNETDIDKNGIPEGAALPGAGISATHGEVYGLDSVNPENGQTEYNPLNYKGGATQGNISIPVCDVCGAYFEGYKADEGSSVWGLDAGIEVGIGPTILAAAHTDAEPATKILGFIPVDSLNQKMNGYELLGCRLLSMCGAR
jgi:RHS repeat-associated protein